MMSRGLTMVLALSGLALLPGCSTTSSILAAITPSAATHEDEPLPQAVDLDQERTRKLYLIVVDRLRQDGKSRAALGYLDAYDKLYPNDAQALLLRGDCLVAIGSNDAAEPVYRQLLDTAYKPAAQAGLGKVAAARSDWPGAVKAFQAAVTLRPTSTEFINNLAYAQMGAGAYDAALETMRQARELTPGSTLVRNNLILCLMLDHRDDEAQTMLRAIADPAERRSVVAMLDHAAVRKPAVKP